MKETQNKWVEAAARVARRLHQGQKDKAEVDYFEGLWIFGVCLPPRKKDYQRLERYRQEHAYFAQIASEEGR